MGCINSSNKQFYTFKRDDIFNVSVVRVQSDQSVVQAKHGFLEINSYELVFIAPEHEPVSWALQHLRRYGLTGNIFSFEAGRRCPTGPGIYTFQCSNAVQFYAKFQRCINSTTADRNNSSIHNSHLFGRLDSHQSHTNHYLDPTSVQVTSAIDERLTIDGSISNDISDFNLNSPDSIHSTTLTAEIINFPSSIPSYSNISPNIHNSGYNIYMEQPIKTNEYNNNISSHDIMNKSDSYTKALKPLLKSASLDVPPDEYAPILTTNFVETRRLYENIDSRTAKSTSTLQYIRSNSSERCYANVDLQRLPVESIMESKQCSSTNDPIVNYIILDLDQLRSPSHSSPKKIFGSGQSLSCNGSVVSNLKINDLSTAASLTCGSSTMPKGSSLSDKSNKLANKENETSGSYSRIDFLKTLALMKSSTNYTDLDLDNDQEESRITRHSKFVRKAYSISE